MSTSTLEKFLKQKKQSVKWEKILNSVLLTNTIYNEQVILSGKRRGELRLFNFLNDQLRLIPIFTSSILSGVIIKTELYVVSCINDNDDRSEPKYGTYKINLDKLDSWIECDFLSSHIEKLYTREITDIWEPPILHNFGQEDLFLSTCGSFMSYKFKTGEVCFFDVPYEHHFILSMTAIEEKIYISADSSHKLCELDMQTKQFKDIDLQDVSNQSPSYYYERCHHQVTLRTQLVNNLQVYRNKYILLNYGILNANSREMKWRFIIYDTKLDTIETSRFYRMYKTRPEMICYGLWVEDSYMFYQNIQEKHNFTSIFNIQEIIGNYRTIETWMVVKALMEKERLGVRLAMDEEFEIIVNFLNLHMDLFRYVIKFLLTPGLKKTNFLRDRLDETEGNPQSQFYQIEY